MNPALESLKSCQLFRPLPEETLQALLDCSEQRSYLPGEALFVETAEEEDVYLITAGSVDIEISLGNQDASYEIVALGAGEILGEMGIIHPSPRSATATARTEVTTLVWPGSAIRGICEANPEVGYRLMTELSKNLWARLIKWNDRVLDSVSWGMDL
jgi:CRP/FNR family cyclic AMP-dependent transcriptional regulator